MKNITTVVLVIAIVGGGYYLMSAKKDGGEKAMNEVITPAATEKQETIKSGESLSMTAGETKEFTVVGSEMKFDVSEIKVKKGDIVKITFKNGGKYAHDWVIDEFNARTKVIKSGETEEITFIANQVGTFEYYCSVMQHRAQGMVGKLIVE